VSILVGDLWEPMGTYGNLWEPMVASSGHGGRSGHGRGGRGKGGVVWGLEVGAIEGSG